MDEIATASAVLDEALRTFVNIGREHRYSDEVIKEAIRWKIHDTVADDALYLFEY